MVQQQWWVKLLRPYLAQIRQWHQTASSLYLPLPYTCSKKKLILLKNVLIKSSKIIFIMLAFEYLFLCSA